MTVSDAIFYLRIDRQMKIDAMSSPEVAVKTCSVIAYDMAIAALEKELPMKVLNPRSFDKINMEEFKLGDCPSCGETVVAGFQNGKPNNNDLRCSRCAQALQWEDEEQADKISIVT